ncbi:hypothetical protein [Streptomyces sp. NPDC056549]|uniref:hypothetical protein n=1 Tax=Streptomyces sp. NPDC056549 TaxID=3345864 RepID=UPI0036795765
MPRAPDASDVPGADEWQAVFNGVDADTGTYLFAPTPLAALAERVRATDRPDGRPLLELRNRRHQDEAHLAVMYGRKPEELASVGWALLTAEELDPAVLDALEPLRRLRRHQAGDLYREVTVKTGETVEEFRSRHHLAPGPVDPRSMPYYLLLAGSPEQIPFFFQYRLGVSYAVGRVHFDTAEEYGSYAVSVIAGEGDSDSEPAPHERPQIHLFGTRNPGDTPTALSASRLIAPLADNLTSLAPGVALTHDIGERATKERLRGLLFDESAPEALFTATHGLGRSAEGRRETQGALLCQDWPGPLTRPGRISSDQYLAGADVPHDRPVVPRVMFSFCCYGAGTPTVAEFPEDTDDPPPAAEAPFVARLPQRLLGNPAGGALAFVSHVDRAWSCSFLWGGLDPQITAMTSTLLGVLDGNRIGHAMEYLSSRYAEISTELTSKLDLIERVGLRVENRDLIGLWTANNDARNYIVLGDPAVRAVRRPRTTSSTLGAT